MLSVSNSVTWTELAAAGLRPYRVAVLDSDQKTSRPRTRLLRRKLVHKPAGKPDQKLGHKEHRVRLDYTIRNAHGSRSRPPERRSSKLSKSLASSWQHSPHRQLASTTEAVSLTTLQHVFRCANATGDFFLHPHSFPDRTTLKKCYIFLSRCDRGSASALNADCIIL
jgi:hypothetical protein